MQGSFFRTVVMTQVGMTVSSSSRALSVLEFVKDCQSCTIKNAVAIGECGCNKARIRASATVKKRYRLSSYCFKRPFLVADIGGTVVSGESSVDNDDYICFVTV